MAVNPLSIVSMGLRPTIIALGVAALGFFGSASSTNDISAQITSSTSISSVLSATAEPASSILGSGSVNATLSFTFQIPETPAASFGGGGGFAKYVHTSKKEANSSVQFDRIRKDDEEVLMILTFLD